MSGPLCMAFDISYGAVEEPAGEEDGFGGADGGGVDMAVQDWLLLILMHDSDDVESNDGMQLSEGRSRIFLLEGGWWLSRTHIPNQTWMLPTNAV